MEKRPVDRLQLVLGLAGLFLAVVTYAMGRPASYWGLVLCCSVGGVAQALYFPRQDRGGQGPRGWLIEGLCLLGFCLIILVCCFFFERFLAVPLWLLAVLCGFPFLLALFVFFFSSIRR